MQHDYHAAVADAEQMQRLVSEYELAVIAAGKFPHANVVRDNVEYLLAHSVIDGDSAIIAVASVAWSTTMAMNDKYTTWVLTNKVVWCEKGVRAKRPTSFVLNEPVTVVVEGYVVRLIQRGTDSVVTSCSGRFGADQSDSYSSAPDPAGLDRAQRFGEQVKAANAARMDELRKPAPAAAPPVPTAPVPTALSPTAPAGWYRDLSGRFEFRFWDGIRWTENVATGGQQSIDPLFG
jgi:hypothetical protein